MHIVDSPAGSTRPAATGPSPAAPRRRGGASTGLRTRAAAARLLWTLVTGAFLVFFALPVVWLLLAPTKTDGQIIRDDPFSFGSLDGVVTAWRNLYSFQDGVIVSWLENSAVYAFGALLITLVTSIPAGYGLALTRFAGRRLLLTTTLLVMIMPNVALVLPLYLEMEAVGLAGTIWSVILPFSFFPFGVYLTYIYFSSTIPQDLLSAARLDGCSEWRVFTSIALPLSRPIVALVAFFSFVGNWNNFFLPFVMLPDSAQYPVQVGLNNLLTSSAVFNTSSGVGNQIMRPELALATIVTVIPVLLVFLFSQRALVSGMLAGATKN
ncbi:multiple sugar transport system permease protein [Streptosporangium becharense]|uniref:Multiple sugar transport system permease protein n=1 Tax=Streptosporangium becharense TaxID=1816182 RepID=A0A7W9ILR1_9ACTN|nr:carbohydrate ABC transporter permease [Streptosporangium becharense]MBB2910341.1 multiple sugar transport system permease protein [Streptosporangium becharense]MBB5823084.1 multiple sugar transport system permease protein [Streptosporangium becharense]